jgi:hypothetical protein
MIKVELIVQILVITSFVIWAYSRIKRQSMKDTFEEVKDFIGGFMNKDG